MTSRVFDSGGSTGEQAGIILWRGLPRAASRRPRAVQSVFSRRGRGTRFDILLTGSGRAIAETARLLEHNGASVRVHPSAVTYDSWIT
jgi:hypothetical protein